MDFKKKPSYASYGVTIAGCKDICKQRNYPHINAIKQHSQLILYNKCKPCGRLIPLEDSVDSRCPCCRSLVSKIAYRIPIRMHCLGITQATVLAMMSTRYPNGVTIPFLKASMKCSTSIGKTLKLLITHGLVYKDNQTTKIQTDNLTCHQRSWHWSRVFRLTQAGVKYSMGINIMIEALKEGKQFPIIQTGKDEQIKR